jgi:hypothetical protein
MIAGSLHQLIMNMLAVVYMAMMESRKWCFRVVTRGVECGDSVVSFRSGRGTSGTAERPGGVVGGMAFFMRGNWRVDTLLFNASYLIHLFKTSFQSLQVC